MTKLATDVTLTFNNGKKFPALGLGTVPPDDPSEVKNQVLTAIKAGYRHIDTAWYYGTEKYVGEALAELFKDGVIKREDVFITTKVWPSYHKNPEKSLDESLRTLGLDYVDLFLQHWPVALSGDENGRPAQPRDKEGNLLRDDDPVNGTAYIDTYKKIEKILDTTDKVRSIGVSNYPIQRLSKLLEVAKHVPVVNQIEAHPQLPQKDLHDFAAKHGIITVAYSPVGGPGAPVLKVPLVQELAKKYDVSVNEIANAYHLLQGRAALPRSSNLERIKTNVRLPPLTEQELNDLYEVGAKNPTRYTNDEWGYGLGFKWWEGDTLSNV